MARPTKLTPQVQQRIVQAIALNEEAQLLAIVQAAADGGDKQAAAWLRGEGYIHITDAPHRALFIQHNEQEERQSPQARAWVKAVYERDGYKCRECGVGGRLNAHHVKAWAEYPESRFDLSNGVTLCVDCHAKKHPHLGWFRKRSGASLSDNRTV